MCEIVDILTICTIIPAYMMFEMLSHVKIAVKARVVDKFFAAESLNTPGM